MKWPSLGHARKRLTVSVAVGTSRAPFYVDALARHLLKTHRLILHDPE